MTDGDVYRIVKLYMFELFITCCHSVNIEMDASNMNNAFIKQNR